MKISAGNLLAVLAIMIAVNSTAQEQKLSGEANITPRVGIKGGLNLSNFYVNEVGDKNLKPGANAGLFLKIPVTRGISIQPEILYSMKGSQINYSNILFGSGKYRFNLNYVETPLIMVFNIAKNFNIHAGPYAAFLVSAKVKDVNSDGTVNGIKELNKDNFNSIDYGAVAGIGFDIENVNLGARFNYGMKEVGKDGRANEVTQGAKNSVISFHIGFGL